MSNAELYVEEGTPHKLAIQPPTRIVRSFSESPTMRTLFEDEQNFQAMANAEVEALASSQAIINFLKAKSLELAQQGGGLAFKWVSAQLLKAFGIGGDTSDLDQIKEVLEQILQNQKLILQKLDALLVEVQFQHLITRSFDAVERIINIYTRLQRLSSVTDKGEREREAALLKTGILDPNLGTLLNLQTIADVMLGRDALGKGEPLINLFADRWFPVYTAKQFADSVPLSTYPSELEAWLRGVFVIQFMGMAELANARSATGDYQLLKQEIDTVIEDMQKQTDMLSLQIPAWTKTLPNSLFDGRWYVIRGRDLQKGKIDNSQVLYGSPAAGSYLDYTVQFRDRHNNNGDEEWVFEKTGNTDTFTMRERSRPNSIRVSPNGGRLEVNSREKIAMRFLMVRNNDPALPQNAPRKDAYLPGIGFPTRGDYMTWTRFGTNVAFAGPLGKAVRLQIEYSGH